MVDWLKISSKLWFNGMNGRASGDKLLLFVTLDRGWLHNGVTTPHRFCGTTCLMSPLLPVAHVEMFNGSVGTGDLHVSVEYNAPRVELFSVVHDDGSRLLHHREHHDGAQRSSRR